jgi:hypothetical protein
VKFRSPRTIVSQRSNRDDVTRQRLAQALLHAIGIPTHYQGHGAIREFFSFVGETLYPDFGFKPQDVQVLIETPEQVFAEYTADTKAPRPEGILHHLFAGRHVAKKGKITLLRESLNTVTAAQCPGIGHTLTHLRPTEVSSFKMSSRHRLALRQATR